MKRKAERRCHLLIAVALVLLTVGIGYDLIVGSKLADFLVIITGLLFGWVAFLYCLGNSSQWRP
jgi:cytochrome b subunit of formate dehydrogenase